MANISTYLAAILSAVYGEDVRGSIHDAIEIINDVSEVVLTTGTAVTSATSSSTGFYTDSLYLNTSTFELWKCVGTNSWSSQGVLKGSDGRSIISVSKTGTAGLVDTYTITYDSGSPDTFTVTNGADGANGADGSVWYKGTAITGTGTGITGCPGNQNDFYLNSSTGMVYTCTATGTISTATWDYVMTLTGGGGSSVTVVDNLNSTSGTDALSANQGHELNTKKIDNPTTKTSGDVLTYDGSAWKAQAPTTGSTTLSGLSDTNISSATDDQFLRYDSSSSKWVNESVTIPAAANNGALSILRNGRSAYLTGHSFSANNSTGGTADIQVDEFIAQGSPNNGTITFTNIDDAYYTTYIGVHAYEVYIDVTSSSTNKSPYAKLSTISGEGTSSMTLVYDTDADNGTNTACLRLIK